MPSVIATGDGLAITAIESEGDAPSPCCRSRFRGRLNTNVGSIARQTRGHSDGLYRLPRRGAEGACRESSSPGRRAWHSAMGGLRCRLYGPGSRDPAISLGRHIVDARLDLFQQFLLVERPPRVSHIAVNANHPSATRASTPGVFAPDAISIASLRNSPSIVFLPRRR